MCDAVSIVEVVVVDDHPAVRTGLAGLLNSETGLACVAAAETAADGLEAARRHWPAVVMVDYHLPDGDGLTLCADLKASAAPPGVILYSAFATPRLLPAAAIAGIDAMVDKGLSTDELFAAVRNVAAGNARLPAAPPQVTERCLGRLDPADIALFGMAVNGTDSAEIAEVMRLDADETRRRLRALLGRLQHRSNRAALGT